MEALDHIPPLTQSDARQFVLEACDLVIFLDQSLCVQDIICTVDSFPGVEGWLNRSFSEIVAPDSFSKVDLLLGVSGWTVDSVGLWRHLNLVLPDKDILPLLLKFISFKHDGQYLNPILICRDLRSSTSALNYLQEVLVASQATIADLKLEVASLGRSSTLGKVGHKSLREIVDEEILEIKYLCAKEAIRKTNGDIEAAAKLLRIHVSRIFEFLQ